MSKELSQEPAIVVDSISKSFKLPHEKHDSIKELLLGVGRGKRSYEKHEVLKNISFTINKGDFFGIVGRNGSGKSTLLKLLAEIYVPDKGGVTISGKLAPFIELGVGFNPELTGRENVFLNGALLGFTRKEIESMYDEVVDFAELERFMDQRLKNYSSGMQVRLAFSIAIRSNADILLLDEVLAVGDAVFQKKCYDYFKQLRKDKKTVVFVSHDTSALIEYCTSGILIEKGSIVQHGKIDKVVNEYIDLLNSSEEKTATSANKKEGKRWGTGEVKLLGIKALDSIKKTSKNIFDDNAKEIIIRATYRAEQAVPRPVYGITITDAGGQKIFTSNTMWSNVLTHDLEVGKEVCVEWKLPNVFNTGTFSISPAVADTTGATTYDWIEDALEVKIRKKIKSISYINADHEINIV